MKELSKNTDVRAYAALNAVPLKQIGERRGLSSVQMSFRLRWELGDSEKKELYETIDEIVKERGDEPKRIQIV